MKLTKIDKNNIRKAFNLLIDNEEDTINYTPLLLKLGITYLED